MEIMLIRLGKTMDGTENYDWAGIAHSILKMQRLGVIEVEFANFLGTISQNAIKRFHMLSILNDIE